MRNIICYFILLTLFSSCDLKTHKDVNVREFNKGKEAIKIKRFTEEQIFNAAYAYGDSLLTSLKGKLVLDSIPPCELGDLKSLVANPLVLEAGIRCQREQTRHAKEAELWDAFQQIDPENEQLFQNTIQRLGNKDKYNELVAVYPIAYKEAETTKVYMLSIVLSKREIIKTL